MAQALDKARWEGYFDHMTRILGTQLVEIEVAGLGIGDQIEADWVPMTGITYDPKDDIVEIALEGVDHIVHHPAEILVEESPAGIDWLALTDASGNRQIVRFRAPLALPRSA
ncbi:MAG TPA: hypothetical protein ENK12_01110 [Gammaproteobacteria bacterium]|nr:hypothetical protein [Gammaproteobacteria bacterium]